jgi:uncharacterized protein
MSEAVAQKTASRITEHCKKYEIAEFTIELHGGEPLLTGVSRLENLIETLKKGCPNIRLDFLLQTNGLLLSDDWLNLFHKYDIGFGVSLDGPPEYSDIFRVYANGKGSTKQLLRKLNEMKKNIYFDRLFGGVLCVIDPSRSGSETVRWFVDNGFTKFDLLLPDANYVNLPQGWVDGSEYRRFLLEAFDEWYSMGAHAPKIRLFERMMMGLMGSPPNLDALGGDITTMSVIETNGAIGALDVLRICGGIFSEDNMSIYSSALDEHKDYYQLTEIQKPCNKCIECSYYSSCGSGYLPHRFDGISFCNPSLYCNALYSLSDRMFSIIKKELPPTVWLENAQE